MISTRNRERAEIGLGIALTTALSSGAMLPNIRGADNPALLVADFLVCWTSASLTASFGIYLGYAFRELKELRRKDEVKSELRPQPTPPESLMHKSARLIGWIKFNSMH